MAESLLNPAFSPLIILVLRVLNNAVGTIRMIANHRGHRTWGFGLASLESLMFAYTAGLVITNLEHLPNLAAYVLGFAAGGYVGMWIEGRFLHIYDTINIIAPEQEGHKIALAIREAGYGVTESQGEGAMGHVMMVRIVVHQREVYTVIDLARSIKPDVFVTVEQALVIHGGLRRPEHQHHG